MGTSFPEEQTQTEVPSFELLSSVLSNCSCNFFTVSLSFASCSWVVFKSSCNLVAACPRSLVSFFSFSSLSFSCVASSAAEDSRGPVLRSFSSSAWSRHAEL